MKGIVLAGGSGSRLYPLTLVTSKQLLPIYDKPMIYYPLSVLMEAGIKDILIISTPFDLPRFEELLKDGSSFGIHLSYLAQEKPEGLAQAFLLGKDFIGEEPAAMVLGDNIFYGPSFSTLLKKSVKLANEGYASVYGYPVDDPERFGVVEFDESNKVINIVEKSKTPKSNYAVTGLYFYPAGVSKEAFTISKSARNEYEITDLNNIYLKKGKLEVTLLDKTYSWLDAGTVVSLFEASEFVKNIEESNGNIAVLEEIAYKNGWISEQKVLEAANRFSNNAYGAYLNKILGK